MAENQAYTRLMNAGHHDYDAGRFQEALQWYLKAAQAAPSEEAPHFNQGNCFMALHQPQEALKAYRQALSFNAQRAKTYNNIGLVYKQLQNWDQALVWYQQALAVDAHYYPACNNLGNLCQTLGEHQEAERWYYRCLELAPMHLNARFNLACLYRDTQQLAAAALLFQQVVTQNPDYAPGWCELGLLALEAGSVKDAQACWVLALKADQSHVPTLIHLARLMQSHGRPAAAEALYARVQTWAENGGSRAN